MPENADKLDRLVGVAAQLTSTLDLDELLNQVMEATTDLLEVRSSSLLLHDEVDGTLRFAVSTADPELVGRRMPATAGVAGECLRTRSPIVVDQAADDPRLHRGVDEATGTSTSTLLAVPLVARERAIGVLEAVNKRSGPFTSADLRLATGLAALAAVAIDNARLYASLADAVVAARVSYRLG